jgi:hypothetical protein
MSELDEMLAEVDEETAERIKAAFKQKDQEMAAAGRKGDRLLQLSAENEVTKSHPRAAKAIRDGLIPLPEADKDEDWLAALTQEEDRLARLGVPDPTAAPDPTPAAPVSAAAAWGEPMTPQPIGDVLAKRNDLKAVVLSGKGPEMFTQLEKMNKNPDTRKAIRDAFYELESESGGDRPIA